MIHPLDFHTVADRILPARLARWKNELAAAALAYQLDPLTLAAIMDRESLGGEALQPKGAGGTGDHGHGRGLMQVDDRAHPGFVAAAGPNGAPLWQDPAFNVLYGAAVLRHALSAFSGDLVPALGAYNAGVGRVRRVLQALPPGAAPEQRRAAVDALTTGRDYVTDVLRRRAQFLDRAATKEIA